MSLIEREIQFRLGLGKKEKEKALHEVLKTFCAIVNSCGGCLRLGLECNQTRTQQDVHDLKRTIQQQISSLIGYCRMRDEVHLSSTLNEILLNVEGNSRLCTMNYNLYYPTETEVKIILPNTEITDVRDLVCQKKIIELEGLVMPHEYHKDFVFEQRLGDEFQLETKTAQFKCLKDEKSKRVSLADRITNKSNKFVNYVSAFAGHRGGHIYYGIDDDGVVKGEHVENKAVIVNGVSKVICKKMIWPPHQDGSVNSKVIKGQHWDIFFEPVKDQIGQDKESIFVIVIYVAFCSGAVFTEKPESYHIVQNEVIKMQFHEWYKRFLETSSPRAVQRCNFSSTTKQNRYYGVMEKMMDLRNQGKAAAFERYIRFVKNRFPECTEVHLATLSQEATFAFRNDQFSQANELIQEYDGLHSKSNENMLVPMSMGLYIKSANERAQENFVKSYDLATEGLAMAEMISPGLIQAWFHTHTGMLANILAYKKDHNIAQERLVKEAKLCFEKALAYCEKVDGFEKAVNDLKQKVFIHLAFLYLGCSLSGYTSSPYSVTEPDDFTRAKNCLMAVSNLITSGYPLSPLRHVQYLLAESDLSLRHGETQPTISSNEQYKSNYLVTSLERSRKALKVAEENQFHEMIRYCRHRKALVVEKLIREAWLVIRRKKPRNDRSNLHTE